MIGTLLRVCVVGFIFANSFSIVSGQKRELIEIFKKCHMKSADFDNCLKGAFNETIVFYKSGVPELGIAPFDPHRSPYIEQRRSLGRLASSRLVLTDVSEYEWTNSRITKFRTEPEKHRFVYSQHFPDKRLDGNYELIATILDQKIHSKGHFNITLHDYDQTTTVTRIGGPGNDIKVRIEVDRIGHVQMRLADKAGDMLLTNSMIQATFALSKPQLDDLISSGFTDIFNESFRDIDIYEFIKD